MKLAATSTIERVKSETLKLLNSEDERLVAHINEDYIAADFFMPDATPENSIFPIKYYGWNMAYAQMADGRMGYTFISSSPMGSIATSPGGACGFDRCALYFDDYDHYGTDAMCTYYSVTEFVFKR